MLQPTPNMPKPPLGWPPWVSPGLARRLSYFARYRLWKLRRLVWRLRHGPTWVPRP